jgi:protein involved in polysaccharide export with SLBB domain
MNIRFSQQIRQAVAVLAFAALATAMAVAQNTQPQFDRTKALPTKRSQAELEADRLVSLSADKIVSLLVNEPGLLLVCKKILVRSAYEQGRILDPEDLTDEAVYRLIREDKNVRVLFTREIEDRYYVRVKPTREELERQERWVRQGLLQPNPQDLQKAATGAANTQALTSQEDKYWDVHENDWQRMLPPSDYTNPNAPQNGVPGQRAIPQGPNQTSPEFDERRQVDRASLQAPDGFESAGDSGNMPRISPDQLSSLIDTSVAAGGMGAIAGGSALDESPLGKNSSGALSSSSSGSQGMDDLGALMGSQNSSGMDQNPDKSQQTASLDYRRYRRPAPYVDNYEPPALRHRPNPYADVPSLYDMYTQYQRRSPKLERFGADIFVNGTGNTDRLPMDLPAGPDYVLGPGDGVTIDLSGSVSQRIRRVVDREGKLVLPEAGAVQVAGKTLGDVQGLVQGVMRTQYRNVQADVSLGRLRSVRVYVVGFARHPGAYDISSLSTPLNAVYEAGGPTSQGSIRVLKHFRGKQLVQDVDVYDLLLHGTQSGIKMLQSGDTILVPPLGGEVTIDGMVRRPAIYELNGEKNLAQVLELAGGVLPTGTLRQVDVDRMVAHESRSMLRLDIPESNNAVSVTRALEDFQVQDGDKIQISPIVPYADKTVYLQGHVFKEGKFAYKDGMKVTDLIRSYKDLQPEPYKQHAEIIRLNQPDNSPEVLTFNLGNVLDGKSQDIPLKPFDTVRVFGRFDFEDNPVISVTGAVRDPGDHITNGTTYLSDAVFLAGGTKADASLDDAQVFRKTTDGKLEVLNVNLSRALAGDPKDNILLQPTDRVFVHKNQNKIDPPTVSVEGEVARPGKYPLGDGMTAAELVKFAGGLKRSAYTDTADLTSYSVEEGTKVVGEHQTVAIAKALSGEPDTDVRLHDGDVLTIRQLSGWKDLGASIKVDGEVVHPGTYGIQEGERLSSIIARAGGFRTDAYPYGSVFERVAVRELEEQNRYELIRRVKTESSQLHIEGPAEDSDLQKSKQAAQLQYEVALEKLQNTPPSGRMVIHISGDVQRWANTPSDIQVRAGDSIYIPKKPSVVVVSGAVYNPTGITYKPGKSAGWYLQRAGSPTELANKKGMFVIRADGSVAGGSGGLFSGGAESSAMQPGDMLVVPEKVYKVNDKWKTALEVAQIATAVGIAIQVARSF